MANTRSAVLVLYKNLIRECQRLNGYNFRMYALEKIKHDFSANKVVSDQTQIVNLIKKGQEDLDIIKRQVLVGHMYGEGHLIIEHTDKTSSPNT